MYTKEELIEFGKQKLVGLIKHGLGKKPYENLIREYINDNTVRVEYKLNRNEWLFSELSEKKFTDVNRHYDYYIKVPIECEGTLEIHELDNKIRNQPLNIKFIGEIWIKESPDKPYFSFDLNSQEKWLVKQYYNKLIDVGKEFGLSPLNDIDFNNKSVTQFILDVIRIKPEEFFNLIRPMTNIDFVDDLIQCSHDILHSISELYLQSMFITHIEENKQFFGGRSIFTYFPTGFDKRYFTISGIVTQLLYTYWSKIALLIKPYFVLNLTKKQINFAKVIESIPDKYHASLFYQWLLEFKKNEYKELNDLRRKIVHYQSLENSFFQEFRDSLNKEEKIKELEEYKFGFVEFFKQQYLNAIKGLEYSTLFIEEKLLNERK